MKYGVLGTGMVGQALAGKLVALGHNVMMGSRDATNQKAITWAKRAGSRAKVGSFAEAAVFGDVLFNCTHGASSIDALRAAGEKHLAEKRHGRRHDRRAARPARHPRAGSPARLLVHENFFNMGIVDQAKNGVFGTMFSAEIATPMVANHP